MKRYWSNKCFSKDVISDAISIIREGKILHTHLYSGTCPVTGSEALLCRFRFRKIVKIYFFDDKYIITIGDDYRIYYSPEELLSEVRRLTDNIRAGITPEFN